MGFQSAGIGRICSWDRTSADGLAVLVAGVGFFCGMADAMATEIGIPFAGVQVLCGGASGVASEVWVQSTGVSPMFCVTHCRANISVVCWCSFRFGNHPLPFLMSDAQERHLSGKTWYDDRWNMY